MWIFAIGGLGDGVEPVLPEVGIDSVEHACPVDANANDCIHVRPEQPWHGSLVMAGSDLAPSTIC